MKAFAVLIGTSALSVTAAADTEPNAYFDGRVTGSDISMNPSDPNYIGSFLPQLDKTVARFPEIDPETGVHVNEVKPGLFYVTEGVYQSAFLETEEGVIVFDAPPSFAHLMPNVISQHAPGSAVKYLIYSHGHNDHVGGASVFSDTEGLEIVAHADVAQSISRSDRPGILAPTITFTDQHRLSLGGEEIILTPASFHAEDMDTVVYLPRQKFVIAVDTITPGDVPFMNFGATSDVGAYLTFFDMILEYDFDHILSGHVAILGTREDVLEAKAYAFDVRDTALKGMSTFYDRFGAILSKLDEKNGNLAYRAAIEAVRRDCSSQIIERWKDRLSVSDVYADSHCQTFILYYIMH
ncbi:MAG: MBL fold metallo-hydrolase [Woeseiaceae bacterium]|nr:MBL fold metallo-hydrolase [Woeseiaceae bacterium]